MPLRRMRDKNTFARVARGSISSLPWHFATPYYPNFIQTQQRRQGFFIVLGEPIRPRHFLVSHASVPRMRWTLWTKCFFHIRHKMIIGATARDYNAACVRYASWRANTFSPCRVMFQEGWRDSFFVKWRKSLIIVMTIHVHL